MVIALHYGKQLVHVYLLLATHKGSEWLYLMYSEGL